MKCTAAAITLSYYVLIHMERNVVSWMKVGIWHNIMICNAIITMMIKQYLLSVGILCMYNYENETIQTITIWKMTVRLSKRYSLFFTTFMSSLMCKIRYDFFCSADDIIKTTVWKRCITFRQRDKCSVTWMERNFVDNSIVSHGHPKLKTKVYGNILSSNFTCLVTCARI